MNDTYRVTATMLNLRSAPAINPANIIGRLGQGELVEKLSDPRPSWFEVRTEHGQGFASSNFLALAGTPMPTPPAAPAAPLVPPQAFFTPDPRSTLASTEMRHCQIGGGLTVRAPASAPAPAARIADLHTIVALLDVERSARYQPTAVSTFCNIYACDFCYLAGLYLPRVWWMSKALVDIAQGLAPPIVYGKTVQELTANALFDWLGEWGDEYGWQRCVDVNDLQNRANQGAVGLISAQRADRSRSGHIVVVLPEAQGHSAERVGSNVVRPLQSQAGRRNKQYFAGQWWIDLGPEFRGVSFWARP
jgi:hypothetical protein